MTASTDSSRRLPRPQERWDQRPNSRWTQAPPNARTYGLMAPAAAAVLACPADSAQVMLWLQSTEHAHLEVRNKGARRPEGPFPRVVVHVALAGSWFLFCIGEQAARTLRNHRGLKRSRESSKRAGNNAQADTPCVPNMCQGTTPPGSVVHLLSLWARS